MKKKVGNWSSALESRNPWCVVLSERKLAASNVQALQFAVLVRRGTRKLAAVHGQSEDCAPGFCFPCHSWGELRPSNRLSLPP